jgi:hypothetical protein
MAEVTALYCAVEDLSPLEATGSELARLPSLERLLARATRLRQAPDWRAWVGTAFGLGSETPVPVGRTVAASYSLPTAGASWFLATPVKLVAAVDHLRLDAIGAVLLEPTVRERLARDHARDFAGSQFSLLATPGGLLLRGPDGIEIETSDPAPWAGREVGAALPRGRDSALLLRHMTELQMWLHARGSSPANALWCWGDAQGTLPTPAQRPALESDDEYLHALARLTSGSASGERVATYRFAALGAARDPFSEAERRWFAPLAESISRGENAELWYSGSVYRLSRWQTLRRWRRVLPWWSAA